MRPSCLCVFTMEGTVRKPGLGSRLHRSLAVCLWASGMISLSLSLLSSKMGLKCRPLGECPLIVEIKKMMQMEHHAGCGTGREEGAGHPWLGAALYTHGCRFRYTRAGAGRWIYKCLQFSNMVCAGAGIRRVWMWGHRDRHLLGAVACVQTLSHVGICLGGCSRAQAGACVRVAWRRERPVTWMLTKMISTTGKMSSSCDLQWLWLKS